MSFTDIIIGDGNAGNTAIHIFTLEGAHGISENSVSYWISKSMLNTDMIIFKHTVEGQTLTNMIQSDVHVDRIKEWLDELVIKNINPALLKIKINNLEKRSYENGKKDQQAEFRKVLGIDLPIEYLND